MKQREEQEKGSRKVYDYRVYHFCGKDWVEYGLRQLIKSVVICYLFYDSCKAAVLILPFAFIDYHNMRERKREEQKHRLTLQFKAMIEALVTSLNAGYSLEHAFQDAKKDLALLYNRQDFIFKELDAILSGLKMNIPLERLLKDFGERSDIDDINNFANVVMAAKRSGGNLIRIIQKTVNSIADKIAVEEEIKTLIAAKVLEEHIMMIMPYGIIFYLRVSNGEFLEVLYHNALGVMLMTLFLIMIYAADIWASKIMEIRV